MGCGPDGPGRANALAYYPSPGGGLLVAGTIGYGPLQRIDGPLPVPAVYGLLPAAAAPAAGVRIVVDVDQSPTDLNDLSSTGETMDAALARLKREGIIPASAGDYRWLNGAEVYPYPPGQPSLYSTCDPA